MTTTTEAPADATTLDALQERYQRAEQEHQQTYRAHTLALLARYRAELAYLEAGGSLSFADDARIVVLRSEVSEWSRVLEHGEDPRTVWPDTARTP